MGIRRRKMINNFFQFPEPHENRNRDLNGFFNIPIDFSWCYLVGIWESVWANNSRSHVVKLGRKRMGNSLILIFQTEETKSVIFRLKNIYKNMMKPKFGWHQIEVSKSYGISMFHFFLYSILKLHDFITRCSSHSLQVQCKWIYNTSRV